jgi:hypothetical protein
MTARVPQLIEPVTLPELHRDYGLDKDEAFRLVTARAVIGQLHRGQLVVERASLEAWGRSAKPVSPPKGFAFRRQ